MRKINFKVNPNLHLKDNLNHAINAPREAYDKQRYNTPLFVLFEMFKAFQRHNALGLSASLSFYAIFALIPLVLLMFLYSANSFSALTTQLLSLRLSQVTSCRSSVAPS